MGNEDHRHISPSAQPSAAEACASHQRRETPGGALPSSPAGLSGGSHENATFPPPTAADVAFLLELGGMALSGLATLCGALARAVRASGSTQPREAGLRTPRGLGAKRRPDVAAPKTRSRGKR